MKYISFILIESIAILGLITTSRAWLASRRAKSWPNITGQVVHKEIKGVTSISRGSRYRLDVRYHYRIAGKEYEGTQWYPKGAFDALPEDRAQHHLMNLPDEVTVYYDPRNPSDAVLNPNFTNTSLLGIAVSLFGVISGILLLLK